MFRPVPQVNGPAGGRERFLAGVADMPEDYADRDGSPFPGSRSQGPAFGGPAPRVPPRPAQARARSRRASVRARASTSGEKGGSDSARIRWIATPAK